MSHEDLCAYSIKKAHSEVMNSRKNKVREALPQITAALIGTSFAIAQPGKLSDKAKTGLGYFVLYNVIGKMLNASREVVDKAKVEDNNKKEALTLGVFALSALAFYKGKDILKHVGSKALEKVAKPVFEFAKNEKDKLVKEVNNTKLGKFVEAKVNPFEKRHADFMTGVVGTALPIGLLFGAPVVDGVMQNSLSKDIKEKAQLNYEKGRAIQKIAKEHFDKIDAKEV